MASLFAPRLFLITSCLRLAHALVIACTLAIGLLVAGCTVLACVVTVGLARRVVFTCMLAGELVVACRVAGGELINWFVRSFSWCHLLIVLLRFLW